VHCPFCSSTSSVVKDSRCSTVVRRRRLCTQCGEQFTTLECISFPKLQVIKSGSIQDFDRDVLLRSIKGVFSRNSSNSDTSLEQVTVLVIKDLHLLKSRKVHSFQIVDLVIKALSGIDKLAAIRFAFAHKVFESLGQCLKFVEALQ
jgi:transcriptional repressor NrdR